MTDPLTARHPRTLEEAFKSRHAEGVDGPFRKQTDWQDKVVLWGCVFTISAVFAFALLGWFV